MADSNDVASTIAAEVIKNAIVPSPLQPIMLAVDILDIFFGGSSSSNKSKKKPKKKEFDLFDWDTW